MNGAVWESLLAFGIVGCGLVLIALIAAAETAIAATSRTHAAALEATHARAARLGALIDRRDRVIGALVIARCLTLAATLAFLSAFLVARHGLSGLFAAMLLGGLGHALVGNMIPRALAAARTDAMVMALHRPAGWLATLFGPLFTLFDKVTRELLGLSGITVAPHHQAMAGADELRGAMDQMHKQGAFEKLDRDMVGGILDLKDLTVEDVMIHRTKMVTVDVGEPPEEAVREVLAAPYTRLPLWRDTPENIVGVVHGKDLLRALAAAGGDMKAIDLASLALPAWFVPVTTGLQDQLKAFLRRKTHFALVVDEYGEVQGLVTLEDIIEEIVGDIRDEHDVQVTGVRPQRDGSVNVDGAVPIRDLNRVMDWRLPDDEAITIAGLVIHEARSIPETRQTFTFHGFRFQVLRKQRNRITALKVTPLEKIEPGE